MPNLYIVNFSMKELNLMSQTQIRISIYIYMQPDGVALCYFKPKLFDITEFTA